LLFRYGTSLPQIDGNKAGNLWITHRPGYFAALWREKTEKVFDKPWAYLL
jgi:hypothetical protein